jgi:hypothetical protein
MKSSLLPFQTMLVLSAFAACGQGTMIFDQQSATNRSTIGGGVGIYVEAPTGQSFIPALSSVGFVQFEFTDPNPGNSVGATVYVNLRAGSLTGPILGSTDPVAMPDRFSSGVTNFFFSSPVSVTPRQTYYLEPVLTDGERLWAIAVGPFAYTGGTFFEFGSPDPNGSNAWFREGVLIPEPPSGLLALLGGSLIWVVGRLRPLRRARGALLLVIVGAGGVSCVSGQTSQSASYYSSAHPDWPPLPLATPGCAISPMAGHPGDWLMADRHYDYVAAESAVATLWGISPSGPTGPMPNGAQPDGLYLEITGNWSSGLMVMAYNVDVTKWFQLQSTEDMQPHPVWSIEQNVTLPLAPDIWSIVTKDARPSLFLRAAQSNTRVWVSAGDDALRGNLSCYPGQPGYFTIWRDVTNADYPALVVHFRMEGTAMNGLDYAYLDGSITIPEGYLSTNLQVNALRSDAISDKTATLTLLPTNPNYLVDTTAASATILIKTNVFWKVANLPTPVGLDYHPGLNSLVASITPDPNFNPTNFVRIDTNGVSYWATATNLWVPVTVGIVKATANGFNLGDMFYGTLNPAPYEVGWLSADGSQCTNTWAWLDSSVNNQQAASGLYLDRSGVFGGDLIIATGGDFSVMGGPNSAVFRVSAAGGQATPVAYFHSPLSGVITLPNDVTRWGPWAGKIITGQGQEDFLVANPAIYAIDTMGNVTTYTNLGIQVEHFNIIPPGQPFYCCDSGIGALWEVPASVFVGHEGQLLITGMGEYGWSRTPALYIVHWDASAGQFVVEQITPPDLPDYHVDCFEDGTFAPIDIQSCAP